MGILAGFAPWIIYWVLVGNVPFGAAVLVALVAAIAVFVAARLRDSAGRTLEIGALATFVVLAVLTFVGDRAVLERWLLPLSTAGILVVAVVGSVTGKPFVREFLKTGLPKEVVASEVFTRITSVLSWIWIATFAGMTVSAAIPPLVTADATLLDTRSPVSFIGYWVVPFSLLGIAAVLSRVLPDRMVPPAEEIVRKTTFVAFAEAEIDQLIYLATEHANREAGPGKEAYDVRIGSKGVPLVGDETRESWPSTYKVRDRKR